MGPTKFDCDNNLPKCMSDCEPCRGECEHDKTKCPAWVKKLGLDCWNDGTQSLPDSTFACFNDDGMDCRQCWNTTQAKPDPWKPWPAVKSGGHAFGPVVSADFEIGLPTAVVDSLVAVYDLKTAELPADVKAHYAEGMHPMRFKFMTQHHVGIYTYNEFWMIAGYLKMTPERAAKYGLQNYTGYFQTSPKLWLNATGPTIGGQASLGMNKEAAEIHFTADGPGLEGLDPALPQDPPPMKYTYTIKGAPDHPYAGKTLMRAEWTTKGEWKDAAEYPHFKSYASQLDTCPGGLSIFEFPPGNGTVKKYSCPGACLSPHDAFDNPKMKYYPPYMSVSRIQEATGSFSIDTAFMDGSAASPGHLPTGNWVINQSIADSPTGAFMRSNYWGAIRGVSEDAGYEDQMDVAAGLTPAQACAAVGRG